jgi:hypothetical protein
MQSEFSNYTQAVQKKRNVDEFAMRSPTHFKALDKLHQKLATMKGGDRRRMHALSHMQPVDKAIRYHHKKQNGQNGARVKPN